MAAGITKIADLIVPEIFNPYMQQRTREKSRLVRSGAVTRDSMIDALLAGGGLTFNLPSYKDLDNEDENVSTDDETDISTPKKIQTSKEIAVRMNRNQSWSSMDLASALAGNDPQSAIANLVADYWVRREQRMFVATVQGIFADNAAAPTGTDTHTQNDMTFNISGASYTAGVTDFSAEAFIDTAVTMGDDMEELKLVMMHSVTYAKAQKNNLIDFIPDSEGRITIPTFLGRTVIVDDGLPNPAGAGAAATAAGIYHTWLFGSNAMRLGVGSARVPVEVDRVPAAGLGAGQEILYSRVEWCLHPSGHAYIGTAPDGGPSNASTANNLAAAGSWSRVLPERKMIRIARLIHRES